MLQILFSIMLIFPLWPVREPTVGDPYLIINKKTNQLAFIEDGKIVKTFSVGTGKTKELTPEGEFTVIVLAKNPYFRPKDIPGGDKRNPLGTRWIGMDALNTDGRQYGIHGTNQPWSIGKYVSKGCIRMLNKNVEWLFERVPIGTKVWIVRSDKTFTQLANQKQLLQP